MPATLRTAQLAPSRSAKRAIVYDQDTGVLAIATGTRCRRFVVEERYAPAGVDGRVFRLTRRGGLGDDHDVLLGTDRRMSSCTCEAHTYESTEKANRRAAERGEAVFGGLGCSHLDSIAYAIDQGWLPDPRANAEQDVAAHPGEARFPEDRLPACFDGCGGSEGADVPF